MGKTQQIIRRRVDELQQNMFVIHQLVIRDKKKKPVIYLYGRVMGSYQPTDQYGGDGAGVWKDVR